MPGAQSAMVQCGSPVKLETFLVQLLKFALDMPPRARVVTGRRGFVDIDLGAAQHGRPLLAGGRKSLRDRSGAAWQAWRTATTGFTHRMDAASRLDP